MYYFATICRTCSIGELENVEFLLFILSEIHFQPSRIQELLLSEPAIVRREIGEKSEEPSSHINSLANSRAPLSETSYFSTDIVRSQSYQRAVYTFATFSPAITMSSPRMAFFKPVLPRVVYDQESVP